MDDITRAAFQELVEQEVEIEHRWVDRLGKEFDKEPDLEIIVRMEFQGKPLVGHHRITRQALDHYTQLDLVDRAEKSLKRSMVDLLAERFEIEEWE